jgi:hypothetical protein
MYNLHYESYLRFCDCYISVYVLFGCSTVVVIDVMWGNCVLGSFLRSWVVLVFDLLSCEGYARYSGYHSQVVYMWSWIFKFDVVYIYLRFCDCYISVYVLFGFSTVVVLDVMWGNCVLGSFLRSWVVLVFDLLSCEG